MAHIYANEIKRWANAYPVGIWYREKNDKEWKWTENEVSWHKDYIYIVDDEFAEIRKAHADGASVQFNEGDDEDPNWVTSNEPTFHGMIGDYRIKPELKFYSLQEFLEEQNLWGEFLENCKLENQRWDEIDSYYNSISDLLEKEPHAWIVNAFSWKFYGIKWDKANDEWKEILDSGKYNKISFYKHN